MPHVIVELSNNLADAVGPQHIVDALHGAAIELDFVPNVALRTRVHVATADRVATGASNLAFVAIEARLGPGRAAEQKHELIETLLDAAEAAVGDDSGLHVAYSCEVCEIEAEFRQNRNRVRTHLEGAPG